MELSVNLKSCKTENLPRGRRRLRYGSPVSAGRIGQLCRMPSFAALHLFSLQRFTNNVDRTGTQPIDCQTYHPRAVRQDARNISADLRFPVSCWA